MTTTTEIDELKRQARAELKNYRERKLREKGAKAAANQTAEEEIARAIRRRRADEAEEAEIQAERLRMYALRDANLAAQAEKERQAKLRADPRSHIAETPARRVAKLLRSRLGDDFDPFMTDLARIDFRLFQTEVRRIPEDERAEALHRERLEREARLRAEAATLPVPETEEEAAILTRHGFPVSIRRAELDAGAL